MNVLGVILARAGSKGLPDKCVRMLRGRPVIEFTFDHAEESKLLSSVVLTTDSVPAAALARGRGIEVIGRPAPLAADTATVDAAARHAVEAWEKKYGKPVHFVVLLYGNIPVRAPGLVDRALEHLQRTGADSVRSVAPVTKQHPDWVHRLEGDRMFQYRKNSIYRRQDLEPLYYHDGAVAAVTRDALFGALKTPTDFQSFLGSDRRAIICDPEDAVDIDGPVDLALAEAILQSKEYSTRGASPDRIAEISLTIGGHRIGRDEPVFVIAEAGVNHNGCLKTAQQLVDAAAKAGADVVKFQVFRAAQLTSRHAATVAYQKKSTSHESQQAMLAGLELDDQQLSAIKQRCDERRILFLGTPFSVQDVARLHALGASAIKLASSDLNHSDLLEAAAATGLPLIASTGAATEAEMSTAFEFLTHCGAEKRTALMHCVSSYPAPVESLNLRAIESLRCRFGIPVGFSDHTTGTATGAWAVLAGACLVEKHFTLDKRQAGPDHAMSLSPEELTQYISEIRDAQKARGTGTLGYGTVEREVRDAARRSVVAQQPIAEGTRITRSMLALKRPGTGIAPFEIERIVGKTATQDIPDDTIICWSMLR